MAELVTALHLHGLRDHCGWARIYRSLVELDGVEEVQLSLLRGLAVVRHDARCDWPTLASTIESGGCSAERVTRCRRRRPAADAVDATERTRTRTGGRVRAA